MINDNQLKALLAIAVIVWGIFLIKLGVQLDQRMLEPLPSVAGVLLVGIGLFDRYLWHWRIWQPWLVSRPDVRGTWRAQLTLVSAESEAARAEVREVFVVIRQTLSTLSIRLLSPESSSYTLGAEVTKSPDGLFRIYAVYKNEPKLSVRDRSPIHLGALALDVDGYPASAMRGHYWTDRRSRGEIRLTERVKGTFASYESAAGAVGGSPGSLQVAGANATRDTSLGSLWRVAKWQLLSVRLHSRQYSVSKRCWTSSTVLIHSQR